MMSDSEQTMSQEIRDRLGKLEVRHEERHRELDKTLNRMADSLETIVEFQNKTAHLGQKLDKVSELASTHHDKITQLEIRQGIMWRS